MSETKISKAIRLAIKRHFPQVRLTRLQSGLITAKHGGKIHCAEEGWPDLIGYLPDGRFLAIEVKTTDGIISYHQHVRLTDMQVCDVVAISVTGVFDCIRQLQEVLK